MAWKDGSGFRESSFEKAPIGEVGNNKLSNSGG
jgi:hypothetical protein